MAFLIPTASLVNILTTIYNDRLQNAHLRTFKSAHVPGLGDVLTNYTAIESSYPGYAPILLNAWGGVIVDPNNNAEMNHAPATFTATGNSAEAVYGYFIVDSTGALLCAEQDASAPVDMSHAGRTYTVTPQFNQGALAPPY